MASGSKIEITNSQGPLGRPLFRSDARDPWLYPIGSMGLVYLYTYNEWLIFMVNVYR